MVYKIVSFTLNSCTVLSLRAIRVIKEITLFQRIADMIQGRKSRENLGTQPSTNLMCGVCLEQMPPAQLGNGQPCSADPHPEGDSRGLDFSP